MTRYSLRAVKPSDRELLLKWRNSKRVRSVMFTDRLISKREHETWFSKLRNREDAVYRIFQIDGKPAGLVSFTGIKPTSGECTWGFYLGNARLPNGTGSRMCSLALQEAFQRLGIKRVRGESFSSNKRAIAVHEQLGFDLIGYRKQKTDQSPQPRRLSVFELSKRAWGNDH